MAYAEKPESDGDAAAKPCILCGTAPAAELWRQGPYRLVKCRSCELAFIENPPGAAELARLYSFETGYMKHYSDPDADFSFKWEKAAHQCDLLEAKVPKGRLLDIGCSAGFFLKTARDRGWDVMGIELSPDTSEIARRRHGLNVITTGVDDSALEAQSFDVITLWDVIEHVPNPLETLHHVKRLLRPGGRVVMETPNIDGLFPRLSYALAGKTGFWPHPEPPFHLFQFSKKTIARVLERAGFEKVSFRDEHIPVDYSFRAFPRSLKSPRRLGYYAVFSSLARLAPYVGAGDALVVFARLPEGPGSAA